MTFFLCILTGCCRNCGPVAPGLVQTAERAPSVLAVLSKFCAGAVWNRVLNGMWKTGSALPVERSVMVQNAQGIYLATQPVTDLDFPWDWGELPETFTSPACANIPDPVRNGELPRLANGMAGPPSVIHDSMRGQGADMDTATSLHGDMEPNLMSHPRVQCLIWLRSCPHDSVIDLCSG